MFLDARVAFPKMRKKSISGSRNIEFNYAEPKNLEELLIFTSLDYQNVLFDITLYVLMRKSSHFSLNH